MSPEEIMEDIFFNYVTEFTKRKHRGYALVHVMSRVEENRAALSEQHVKYLMDSVTRFSEQYQNAWPWSRPSVVAQAMRNFQLVLQNN